MNIGNKSYSAGIVFITRVEKAVLVMFYLSAKSHALSLKRIQA